MRTTLSLSCLGTLAALFLTAAPAASLAANVIAHWSFDAVDAKGDYPDSVDNQHPATPVDGNEVLVYNGSNPAPSGKAIMLLGPSHPNSYLTIPPLNNIQTTSFTVAVWVNLASQNTGFVLTDWPSMTQSAYAFGFHPFGPNKNTAQPNGNITSMETIGGRGGTAANRRSILDQKLQDRGVTLNAWHHVAWVWDRDAGSMTFYYDGTSWGETRRSPGPNNSTTLDIAKNNLPVRIGSQQLSVGNGPANFNGSMDELWIFDEVLTPIQLRNLREYNDISGKPAPVAPTPAPTPIAVTTGPATVTPAPTPATKPIVATAPVRPTTETTGTTESSETPTTKPANALAGVTPPPGGLSIGRLIGVVSCLLVIILMSSYLTWAFVERAKLQARRT
jgi:hypothetical protein